MSEPGRDRLLTYADYAALPDDGNRYQLLEGELVMTPSPRAWHQQVSYRLEFKLLAHVQEHDLGEMYHAPLDVTLDDHNVVQPDIFFISKERAGILQDGRILGAPDMCVEILSPGTVRLDRVRKLELYARFDVTHYWIVDLERADDRGVRPARATSTACAASPPTTSRSGRPCSPGSSSRLNIVPLPDGL